VAALLNEHQLLSTDIKAGCARCGACTSLKAREQRTSEVAHA